MFNGCLKKKQKQNKQTNKKKNRTESSRINDGDSVPGTLFTAKN